MTILFIHCSARSSLFFYVTLRLMCFFFFFLNDRAPPKISPLPLPDPFPIGGCVDPSRSLQTGERASIRPSPARPAVDQYPLSFLKLGVVEKGLPGSEAGQRNCDGLLEAH